MSCLLMLDLSCSAGRSIATAPVVHTVRQFVFKHKLKESGGRLKLSIEGFTIPDDSCNVIIRLYIDDKHIAAFGASARTYLKSLTFGHRCNERLTLDITERIKGLASVSDSYDLHIAVELADINGRLLSRPDYIKNLKVDLLSN